IVYSYNVFKCIENQVSQSTLHAYAAGCLTPSRPVAYQGECTAISSRSDASTSLGILPSPGGDTHRRKLLKTLCEKSIGYQG
ncbi:MAG: hypothetical protein ACLPX5_09505, partial [Dissulfurispiraceae bacterium]